ncbi:hypothetical protein CBS9595_000183 [Malassezia furfur]|nr:hypothetical protein CBS9595_000183 [Malassezia furfur]
MPTHADGADDAAHLALAAPDGEDAEARSRAFHFPYPVAYDVQLALMTALFDAIEHRRVGVFESPTGTGKTLSLLCSAFTWLHLNQHRAAIGTARPRDSDEPDWVVAHDEAARRARLAAHDAELNDKLRAIRTRTRPTPAARAPKKRIYYASRTHSQLAQLIHELKRTPFGRDAQEVVRTISLGSRRQMCVNAHVQRIGATFGMEAMNERCLELMESRSRTSPAHAEKRCPYLPPADAAGDAKMDTFRDHALELVALGKEMHVCPYFGARRAVADAQLIALPYNLLLQQDAREALALHLDDSVIIIDEAHNLIDTLLGTYSVEVSEAHLAQAAQQVTAYLDRFAMQLKGTNEEHLRTLQVFLTAAQAYCVHAKVPDALSTADFVARLGGSVDQINVRGASHSPSSFGSNYGSKKRASRVSGYADRLWLRAHPHDPPSRHTHVHAMHLVERLLLALGDRTRNGRILVARRPDGRVGIKYILLNPADAFQPLLDAARSVVLAGGTMAPIAEFERQLFAHDPARFTSYSCGHIVAPANVLGAVVASGPKGVPLEFTHAAWDNAALLDELGNALSNYCNLVPHGMIVFFPSYTNLHKTLAHWRSTRLLERLAKRKRVFQEPTDAHDVEAVLQGYAAAIASPTVRRTLTQPDAPKGAILFAVVNAKLSEGINFQDDLARCVVMVGLPFPNAHSPELAERMAYMRQLDPHAKTDLGRDLYLNLCMRAVNQSMGRAIRHEHDYTSTHERFGSTVRALAAFFREKKQGAS